MKRYDNGMVDRVRLLREEKRLSIGEIAKQTGVSTVTVFNWVKDMAVVVPHSGGRNGGKISPEIRKKMGDLWRQKAADKRRASYDIGKNEADDVLADRDVRDFVCLYWAEGYKKSRNTVSLVNTDPAILRLVSRVMKKFVSRPLSYRLMCSKDERHTASEFWARELGIESRNLKFYEKVRKGKRMAEAGLMEVRVGDTYFRSRLQAWMDRVKKDWLLPL